MLWEKKKSIERIFKSEEGCGVFTTSKYFGCNKKIHK